VPVEVRTTPRPAMLLGGLYGFADTWARLSGFITGMYVVLTPKLFLRTAAR
jgi:hypothetical protein